MKTCCLALCIALSLAAPAAAEMTAEVPPELTRLSDAEIQERLDYLITEFDHDELYGDIWYKGWIGFYGIGVVYSSVKAAHAEHNGDRADRILSAAKAVGGIAEKLARPLVVSWGSDPIRELPAATREDRLRQLALGEEMLRQRAKQANGRYSILRHAMNLGVNVAAGVIVAEGFGAVRHGWTSAGIGIAVGEIMIWSQPWWPPQQLEEYHRRFNGAAPQRISWYVIPSFGGLTVQARF